MKLTDIHWWGQLDKPHPVPPKPQKRIQKNGWTEQELQFLRNNWPTMDTATLAAYLQRPQGGVATLASRLGLKRNAAFVKALRSQGQRNRKDAWTETEVQYLRKNWQTKTRKEMASELGRSTGAIQRQAYMLRLIKTPEAFRAIVSRPNSGQFKKGNLPPQTVLGDEQVIRIRHNHKRNFYTKFIRVGFRQWKEYQHHIWEKANGPVPKGMILAFINGDRMDCRLENLKLITKKENALRNSGSLNLADGYVAHALAWHNKPMQEEMLKHPELIDLKRNQLKLNRAIRNESKRRKTGE